MVQGLQVASLSLQDGPLVSAVHLRSHPQELKTTAQICLEVRCITIKHERIRIPSCCSPTLQGVESSRNGQCDHASNGAQHSAALPVHSEQKTGAKSCCHVLLSLWLGWGCLPP